MSEKGYYRRPHLSGDRILFVSEDDLWLMEDIDDSPARLTTQLTRSDDPCFSPAGDWIAFTGESDGPSEVYVMPGSGGTAERRTYLGAGTNVVGWTPDGDHIVFASNARQPLSKRYQLWKVPREGGEPEPIELGPAQDLSFGDEGRRVIGRNIGNPAHWKQYRGGRTGEIWIEKEDGSFEELVDLTGNVSNPMWVQDRIYFLSDHEGIGNLYSVTPEGEDAKKHTDHDTFYARDASTDGERIVYRSGGNLYVYNPDAEEVRTISPDYRSSEERKKRRYVSSGKNLHGYDPHPDGHSVALIVRGKPFTMPNWEKAVLQHGEPHGVRYRLARWLPDGDRVVTVSDRDAVQCFELFGTKSGMEDRRINPDQDIGRPVLMETSPEADELVFTNHRYELVHLDLERESCRMLDRSNYRRIAGIAWGPNGRFVAYGCYTGRKTSEIKLYDLKTDKNWSLTEGDFRDVRPSFDPEGRYLYFLSFREFDPVYDRIHFDLNFPRGMRPYVIPLRKDVSSPFEPEPRPPGNGSKNGEESGDGNGTGNGNGDEDGLNWDLEDPEKRIVRVPVGEGIYGRVGALEEKLIYSVYPVEGSRDRRRRPGDTPRSRGVLKYYDFKNQEKKKIVKGIAGFRLSTDRSTLIYRRKNRLRVLEAGETMGAKKRRKSRPGRSSGWLDLSRVKVAVEPEQEWKQQFRESWQLQREHFWDQDMSGVDWNEIYDRYKPLLKRIGSRNELTDLMKEMQGELGTSHAYVIGGDKPDRRSYTQGFLGGVFQFDPDARAYRLERIPEGDVWNKDGSPLCRPGVQIKPGDLLLAVGGQPVSRDRPPEALLENAGGEEVALTIRDGETGEERREVVGTLTDETPLYYREWVEDCRSFVHEQTDGEAGYVHIPDMGPRGYAEFHRYFLGELERDGLIVDVRYNGGGHVSSLVLEKLARRRLGYDVARWRPPKPYPSESIQGPLVALINEYTGSDGDIFSHCFKLMNLGPVVGRRTWGGVIGIWPRYHLVDGGYTTQPEFSYWFKDVGWDLENYGTEPDEEVHIRPGDHRENRDPQLVTAVEILQEQIEAGREENTFLKPPVTSEND